MKDGEARNPDLRQSKADEAKDRGTNRLLSAFKLYEIFEDEGGNSSISFTVPKDLADGYINNKREVYKFRFVVNLYKELVADLPVELLRGVQLVVQCMMLQLRVNILFLSCCWLVSFSVLTGYNGTIFAYGQTGSGKTFTITGGAERYVDRGLIPRSLSYIFEYFEKHPGTVFTAHISYLEIYNENGYDLLDPKHEACKLEDLPKVNLFEDSDNNVHLKNLSLHQASNEEEALNLLFLGDTNRMIAETPMNQASTRSHCIFTIHISTRDPGSATIRRAKLHLVDLAGSERVGKTNVGGTLLTEAKYINLSLHYLEQVIVALSEKSRSHIPYRNSMMTSVLRDSLGGNCMTSMIATCSLDRKNLDESISTCRFAQRVAMIKNDVLLNEEIDPKLLIAQLKAEVQRLKDELAMSTGQEYTGELTEDELDRLRRMVKSYIEDSDPESSLSVGADMRKINYCFQLLKNHVSEKSKQNPSPPPQRTPAIDGVLDSSYLGNHTEVNKLKELIRQRDNEINILYHRFEKRYWYNSWLCCGCMNWLTRGYVLLNWETTGLTSRVALFASATVERFTNLFKLDELDESSKLTKEEHSRYLTNTHEEEDAFIGQMDREATLTLGKLSADVENFTLRELKQIHRRSRVAIEAGMTNNLHVHKHIIKLLESHVVFDSERHQMRLLDIARKEVIAGYKTALERCSTSHDRLRDAEKQRLQAEEDYIEAVMVLNRAEQEKKKVIAVIETQQDGGNILVGMLKKEKKRTAELEKQGGGRLLDGMGAAPDGIRRSASQSQSDDSENELSKMRAASRTRVRDRPSSDTTENRQHPQAPGDDPTNHRPPSAYRRKLDEMSVGRKEAFETFRRDYPHNDTIEENKQTLKQRYAEAKRLGEQVNSSRQKISKSCLLTRATIALHILSKLKSSNKEFADRCKVLSKLSSFARCTL
ncbi:hypothetical protein pdam_00016689 [Pocillopora damicornis]|uniref:Kinesin-like protein n=1 Tax=Pocillopora damicornis TaxID=46731 RepID=A0A3M6V5I3_POCDA|nr:hypothetical protein pdam_00016689 [Pocillopora damicornis]